MPKIIYFGDIMQPNIRLVNREELMFGKKGPFAKALSGCVMAMFGLNRLNRFYAGVYHEEDFTGSALQKLNIKYTIDPADLSNIPESGPLVIIGNHPTGALDGIMLIDALSKVRPDVKFMGNFILNRIEPIRDRIIAVDPFDSRARDKNLKGLKQSIDHLNGGGCLVMFPAGEVATWQKGFSHLQDKEWEASAMKFIRRAKVPVLSLFIEAKNSTLFRLMGKIHPMLRTAMIPRELFNKRNKTINIVVGSEIGPNRTESLSEKTYNNYMRATVDYLGYCRTKPKNEHVLSEQAVSADFSGIVERPSVESMRAELDSIRRDYLLFDYGEFSLYCVPSGVIPNVMQEIGRMREITFRAIGEGTFKEIDVDKFDGFYHQMFLWDNKEEAIVGAYRVGFGDEIMPAHGIEGFYTNTLFRYAPDMASVLEKTIELGRSFIAKEYQRKPNSLMLLWKGLLYVMLKYPQFRYMLGPVTISGDFQDSSKSIIAAHLKYTHYNEELAAMVSPVLGMKGIKSDIDTTLIKDVEPIDLIGKIVMDIEQEKRNIPVLIKKYIGLNSTVLGFNVDPDFNNALDALMLLDMKHIPENTIQMLSKEITDIDVMSRFKNIM